MKDISKPTMRRRKLRAIVAFCLIEGFALTSKMTTKIRDESNKERWITNERTPLTVLRKINSGTELISIVGNDGSLGVLIGNLGIIMTDHATNGLPRTETFG
jgi:hypothetical protein